MGSVKGFVKTFTNPGSCSNHTAVLASAKSVLLGGEVLEMPDDFGMFGGDVSTFRAIGFEIE